MLTFAISSVRYAYLRGDVARLAGAGRAAEERKLVVAHQHVH